MSMPVHNVVQLSDADVLSRFVVRQAELDALLEHLRESDPPRHALVIGPRGMGKSLLLRRVAIAVSSDAELAARWLPVTMAEELYEVTTVGELWLAALDRLAEILGDSDIAAQRRALLAEVDPRRLEELARERLLGAARARGKQILLLAENLDMLLGEQVSSEEGWTLRQALQTERELLLMASAVTTFAGVEDGNEPFYGFFHRIDLRPLDDTEVGTLWRAVTGVRLPPARALAVRILTGGNPRLIAVLARFTQNPDLSNLRQDVELLIDEYTPFFKANIEALPAVERKVFVTLADIWAPATAAEVAQQARMETSKVSALLGRLMRRGAVCLFEEGDDAKRRYELTERLYNLYHLLRRPGDDGRVLALVDILVHLYDPAQLGRDIWPHIVAAGSGFDVAIASRLHRHLDDAEMWEGMRLTETAATLPVLESLLTKQRTSLGDDHEDTLLTRQQIAYVTGETGDVATALVLYREVADDQARTLGPDHHDTLTSRHGVAYCTAQTGDVATALTLYRHVAADSERVLGPYQRDTLTSRRQVAGYTAQTGDAATALTLYRHVAADSERVLGPDHRHTLISRHQVAYYTGETGDAPGALALFRQVAADRERVLGPDHRDTLTGRHNIAHYTGETGDAPGALALFRQVAADRERVLGPDHRDTLMSRHQVAYYTGKTGDAPGALALVRQVAADRVRVLGPYHRDTLMSRHQVAYYLRATGDARAALVITEDVLHRAEATLPEADKLLFAVRWLRTELRFAARAQPLPRELREIQEAATPRPPAPEPRRRRSGPRRGS